ncbi:MFS transporter [Kitasatospora sp. NBC_01287]|uniref:MFS transporter n=1 Tax=Kitasatospora sp. NBC_01287 TaxID=2903573 RepID=UPI002251E6B8|nr:MFS transporter [Kitasatospora sp. NBC_01287]MCX4750797.1 MFS transporter [Kitasatospora sp. NBC_01287]
MPNRATTTVGRTPNHRENRPRNRTAHRPRPPSWAGRDYLIQTGATVVSGLGNAGAPIATAFALLRMGGGAAEIGYVTGARLAAIVLFLLIGGAVADRLPRHRVMVAANLGNALSQAALAALVLTGSAQLWQVVLLAAANGIGQAFYAPAAEGMIMESVDQEQAPRAFALFRTALNSSQIGGAALGGALVAAVGPGWVLALDATTLAAAGALRVFLRTPAPAAAATALAARGGGGAATADRCAGPGPGPDAGREGGPGMLADLREGWREFTSRRWLWAVVVQYGVVNACLIAAESVLGPLVADQRLGGPRPWGLVNAAMGAGLVAGGLLMVRWQPRRLLLAGTFGILLFAAPAASLAAGASLTVIGCAMFASGVGGTVYGVCWMVALQQEIPAASFSRVAAYDWCGSVALAPVGTVAAAPLAGGLGLNGALWACAGGMTLLSVLVLAVPEVRRLARVTAVSPAAATATAATAPLSAAGAAGSARTAGSAGAAGSPAAATVATVATVRVDPVPVAVPVAARAAA